MMRDQLLPNERIFAIQEAMEGFIYEHVVKKDCEFHYDGMIVDRSKY